MGASSCSSPPIRSAVSSQHFDVTSSNSPQDDLRRLKGLMVQTTCSVQQDGSKPSTWQGLRRRVRRLWPTFR